MHDLVGKPLVLETKGQGHLDFKNLLPGRASLALQI